MYTFLQLKRFQHSWSLRTEHGMSPAEMWTSGVAAADSATLNQPVTEDYGVEDDNLSNPFE